MISRCRRSHLSYQRRLVSRYLNLDASLRWHNTRVLLGGLLFFLFSIGATTANATLFPIPPKGTGAVVVRFNHIAQMTGVPAKLLYSIALTESGKKYKNGSFKPWPWTINVQGQPLFFRTREAAWLALTTYLSFGITLIDIGLMQVNWHYHKYRLKDPWLALDPNFNTRVGAQILREQYREDGDWFAAAGRYHAPVAWFNAVRYQAKVLAHYKKL